MRSFKVILLCKILVEGISDIKLSLCIRWLDFLCLGFNEHVFEAKVEAEKRLLEVAGGYLRLFCCPEAKLKGWENICERFGQGKKE